MNKVTPGFKRRGVTVDNICGKEFWTFAKDPEAARYALADTLMRRESTKIRMECDTGEVFDCVISPVPEGVKSIVICEEVPTGNGHITERERQVIALMANDTPTRDIARKLGIAHSTVETHIHNAKGRLGIVTSMGLVAYAIRNGIV